LADSEKVIIFAAAFETNEGTKASFLKNLGQEFAGEIKWYYLCSPEIEKRIRTR